MLSTDIYHASIYSHDCGSAARTGSVNSISQLHQPFLVSVPCCWRAYRHWLTRTKPRIIHRTDLPYSTLSPPPPSFSSSCTSLCLTSTSLSAWIMSGCTGEHLPSKGNKRSINQWPSTVSRHYGIYRFPSKRRRRIFSSKPRTTYVTFPRPKI